LSFFISVDTATSVHSTLSLHDALPICNALAHGGKQHQHQGEPGGGAKAVKYRFHKVVVFVEVQKGHTQHRAVGGDQGQKDPEDRSEEHTSELQSRENLVSRLLHEKNKR